MTTTQAIKLLKNGEAQLCLDKITNPRILSAITGTVWLSDFKKYCVLVSGCAMWGDAEFWSFGAILPIIKLSEIEQECMECVYETSTDGMRTVKVAECRNCKAIKYALQMPDGKTYDVAPPKTIATIHSVGSVKNNLSCEKFYKSTVEEKPNHGRVEKTGESEYTVYLTKPLKPGETLKLDELSIEKPKLEISKEMTDFCKSHWFTGDLTEFDLRDWPKYTPITSEVAEFTIDDPDNMFYTVFKDCKDKKAYIDVMHYKIYIKDFRFEKLENKLKIIWNKPNTETMQVTTNENGEITLSGITIDNDTVDRIVAIWKEQTERAKMPEMNKWHKSFRGHLYFFKEVIGNNKYIESYGFNSDGKWSDSTHRDYDALSKYEPATDQEVTEALKGYAEKKGYEDGNYNCMLTVTHTHLFKGLGKPVFEFYAKENRLVIGAENTKKRNVIFDNGKWATIIEKPTYTHAQLEKKLGETFNYKGE